MKTNGSTGTVRYLMGARKTNNSYGSSSLQTLVKLCHWKKPPQNTRQAKFHDAHFRKVPFHSKQKLQTRCNGRVWLSAVWSRLAPVCTLKRRWTTPRNGVLWRVNWWNVFIVYAYARRLWAIKKNCALIGARLLDAWGCGDLLTNKSADDRLRCSCGYKGFFGRRQVLSQFFFNHSPHVFFVVRVMLMKAHCIEDPLFQTHGCGFVLGRSCAEERWKEKATRAKDPSRSCRMTERCKDCASSCPGCTGLGYGPEAFYFLSKTRTGFHRRGVKFQAS